MLKKVSFIVFVIYFSFLLNSCENEQDNKNRAFDKGKSAWHD